MHVHSIRDDRTFMNLGVASKLDADWTFLTELRDKGRAVAASWLDQNYATVGQRSSVDLAKTFL
jgi:NTE family protein